MTHDMLPISDILEFSEFVNFDMLAILDILDPLGLSTRKEKRDL